MVLRSSPQLISRHRRLRSQVKTVLTVAQHNDFAPSVQHAALLVVPHSPVAADDSSPPSLAPPLPPLSAVRFTIVSAYWSSCCQSCFSSSFLPLSDAVGRHSPAPAHLLPLTATRLAKASAATGADAPQMHCSPVADLPVPGFLPLPVEAVGGGRAGAVEFAVLSTRTAPQSTHRLPLPALHSTVTAIARLSATGVRLLGLPEELKERPDVKCEKPAGVQVLWMRLKAEDQSSKEECIQAGGGLNE